MWSLMKMNILIFSSLLAAITSVNSKTVACKILTKDHPLAIKDEFSDDYLVDRDKLNNRLPLYGDKLFFYTGAKIDKTEKEKGEGVIHCDLSEGMVICPARQQASPSNKRPKSFRQIMLLKLPHKVKDQGYYKMSSKRGAENVLNETYIPKEFYKYYPHHKKFLMYNSHTSGKLDSQFDFYVLGKSAYALTHRSSGGRYGGEVFDRYCILDLDLEKFPILSEDISVPASEQKR